MKLMIWCAARGGMRSVVEAYERDGFLKKQDVCLIASYREGSFLSRQLALLRAIVQFIVYCLSREVKLVHVHAAMRGSFWRKSIFTSLARLFGIPTILHLHGSEMKPFYMGQPLLIRKLIRRQLEMATRVVVLSESWRRFVCTIAPSAKISVVPNYVDVQQELQVVSRNSQDILFLGLIGQRKGVFDLIPAFAVLAPEFPGARLLIGGNGETEIAQSLVREHNLEGQVKLLGWVSGEERKRLLDTSSIYVLPSYNEGLPMSVLEAMSAGLAVVTTRVGGVPELVSDGVDGLLIDAGDRTGLTHALVTLLSDDALRSEVAAAGRLRVVEKYSSSVVLPMLEDIYNTDQRK